MIGVFEILCNKSLNGLLNSSRNSQVLGIGGWIGIDPLSIVHFGERTTQCSYAGSLRLGVS